MTSNLGAKLIQEAGEKIDKPTQENISELVTHTFPPEFINRLDQIIIFEPLTTQDLKAIVDIQLDKVIRRLKDKDIILEIAPHAKDALAKIGYDPIYGARPLRRLIRSEILDPLALMVLNQDLSGKTVKVTAVQDKLILKLTWKFLLDTHLMCIVISIFLCLNIPNMCQSISYLRFIQIDSTYKKGG